MEFRVISNLQKFCGRKTGNLYEFSGFAELDNFSAPKSRKTWHFYVES